MSWKNILSINLFIVIFFGLLNLSYADSKLSWQAPEKGVVKGYKIYYGTSSGNYTKNEDVGNVTQYSLSNLNLGDSTKYYFIIKAYNDAGESGPSNEISWLSDDSTPPNPPQGLHFK